MAIGAGGQPACRITPVIQAVCGAVRARGRGVLHREWQLREIGGDRIALRAGELAGGGLHLRVLAPPVRVRFKLGHHIAPVQPRQPGRPGAIAATVEAMAGDAGIPCAAIGTAQGNQFSSRDEVIRRPALTRTAAAEQQQATRRPTINRTQVHPLAEPPGAASVPKRDGRPRAACKLGDCLPIALALLSLLLAAGCKPPPQGTNHMPRADAARGKAAIERVGCGACHTIPGIAWPQGAAGPSLQGFARQALIAGRLPNRPDRLAAFVRNAPATLPDTSMPAMPLTEAEARDVAAYLYQAGKR